MRTMYICACKFQLTHHTALARLNQYKTRARAQISCLERFVVVVVVGVAVVVFDALFRHGLRENPILYRTRSRSCSTYGWYRVWGERERRQTLPLHTSIYKYVFYFTSNAHLSNSNSTSTCVNVSASECAGFCIQETLWGEHKIYRAREAKRASTDFQSRRGNHRRRFVNDLAPGVLGWRTRTRARE